MKLEYKRHSSWSPMYCIVKDCTNRPVKTIGLCKKHGGKW